MTSKSTAWFATTLAAAIGITASAAGTSVASSPPDSDGGVTTPTASGPLDELTWYGDYRPITTLDPVRSADYPEQTVIPNLCESLLVSAADGSLHPGLATEWEQTDATHVVFTIRDGVTFSDGSPLTADDVVFSLSRHLDPAQASSWSILFDSVDSVDAQGEDQVLVTLKGPNAVFVQGMGSLGGAVISRAHAEAAGDALGTPDGGVLCTGPYVVDKWSGVGSISLRANEQYWNSDGAPLAALLTFEFPTDPLALSNAIQTGVIDGGFNLPAELIPALQSGPGSLHIGGEGSTPQNLDMIVTDLAGGPLGDPAVRRALSAAIDREALATAAFGGAADPLFTVAGPGLWGYARDQYEAAYEEIVAAAGDPADAIAPGRAAVSEAGAEGAHVRLAYPGGIDLYETTATLLQQTGQQIGLDVEIVAMPLAQYYGLFTDAAIRAEFDAFLTMNYTVLREPAVMYGFIGTKDGSQNYGGYDNATVDELLRSAYGEPNPEARAALVIEAQSILAEELPWIPIVAPRSTVYLAEGITGAPLTFAYMSMPWAAAVGAAS